MQKTNKITQHFPEILVICYFMQDHIQLKQHDNTVASMNVQLHATNKQNNSMLPRDIGTLLF